jgi:hypothetical protein
MRNTEIPEEGGQFRIPGVGRVKTLHHQESRNREMRNAEIPKAGDSFGYRIPELGMSRTLTNRSPEVAKPEVAKCEIVKCQRLHTGGSDTGSWRCQGLSRQESRSCEVRKAEKLI